MYAHVLESRSLSGVNIHQLEMVAREWYYYLSEDGAICVTYSLTHKVYQRRALVANNHRRLMKGENSVHQYLHLASLNPISALNYTGTFK